MLESNVVPKNYKVRISLTVEAEDGSNRTWEVYGSRYSQSEQQAANETLSKLSREVKKVYTTPSTIE